MSPIFPVEPLISVLKDSDSSCREGAAEALGEIKDHRAVMPLIDALLKDEDSSVRWEVAVALGEIQDTRAIEPLIARLKDKHMNVRRSAAQALERITGLDFGQDRGKWRKW